MVFDLDCEWESIKLLGDEDENGDNGVGECGSKKLLGDEVDNGDVKDDDRWSVKLLGV